MDSERLLCLHGSLNHLYGIFLLGFLWPANLLCLVLSHIWFISGSAGVCVCVCVCVCVLAKMDSSKEAYKLLDITPFFDLQGTFLCVYDQEALLVWSLCPQRTNQVAFPGRPGRGARHLLPALSPWKNTQSEQKRYFRTQE